MPVNLLPQRLPEQLSARLGRSVARAGITANMISLGGFAGNVLCAVLVARGELLIGGITYLVFSALDLVDGAVARATGSASPYGAVLDAVLDRASEASLLAGMAWYFADRDNWTGVGLTYASIFGSVAVSYVRARAEAAGKAMREGLFRRQERVLVLGAGLLLSLPLAALWLLAIASNLTVLQRVWLLLREPAEAGRGLGV
jgi:CDP-diacylglycerol--glycerol-3-phosphate 3-phosphatidyltransferase